MGGDVSEAPKSHADPGVRLTAARRRPAIRIDMTPMVDVAFLLLIFFMVTTVFRRPLAMEINMPEPGAKVEVPESNVMTVLVGDGDLTYRRMGRGALSTVEWDDLGRTFRESAAQNPDIIILARIHREARYERMVDIMDVLEDSGIQRFSVIPMTDEDVKELEGAR